MLIDRLHSFMDRLDRLLNPVSKPREARVITTPVIDHDQTYLKFRNYFRHPDVFLSLVALVAIAGLLVIAPSDASVTQLVYFALSSDMARGAAKAHKMAFPRVVSADLVLILVGVMAANSLAQAVIRVVEATHRAEKDTKELEALREAYDVDPEKAAAYAKKKEAEEAAIAERRAALAAENEQRAKDKKRLKRDKVVISGIVPVEAVTDAMVPLIALWPIALGTIVIVMPPNAVRGIGAAVMLLHLTAVSVLAKMLGSTFKALRMLNMFQSVLQLLLLVLVAAQCYNE